MYATFANHFEQMLHFLYGFALVFVVFARLLIRKQPMPAFERIVTNYVQMVFFVIVLGYLLVLAKLWEVLAIVTVIMLLSVRLLWLNKQPSDRAKLLYGWITLFFDWTEKKRSFGKDVRAWTAAFAGRAAASVRRRLRHVPGLLFFAACCAVFGVTAYIRFYDAFRNAVPPMADGNVTLAWIKYIDSRILFNDGIYPQGNHLYMNTLQKFAAIDPLYVLKYNGPLNGVLITAAIYYAVSRLSLNKYAGLTAAALYGIFGSLFLGSVWDRQAAPNSQEFAFVFVFLGLYYMYRYLASGGKEFARPAFAGLAVTGLVHSLAFGLAGLGSGVLFFVFLLRGRIKALPVVLKGAGIAIAAVIVSVLPLGIGTMLLRREVHESSANYLVSETSSYEFPLLHVWDYATLAACAVLLLYALLGRLFKAQPFPAEAAAFAALLGLGTFFLYYWGGYFTGSRLIESRSGELWTLVLALCLGMCAALPFHAVSRLRWRHYAKFGLLSAGLAAGFSAVPVEPIVPYKLQWHEEVEQYLRIKSLHPAKSWMIAMESDGYAVILNNGVHMHTRDFLDTYDPSKPPLTVHGESRPSTKIPEHIYVYLHKDVFRVSETNSVYSLLEEVYAERERNRDDLMAWIREYESANGPANIFYEDDHLRIYYFKREVTRDEVMSRIWGGQPGESRRDGDEP